ncbi:fumarylacetoacetate hydrolase family protein [Asticcacaulis sp. AND118]|uniref:fumarylacetoacetate hydrolase family protein n=1 Tax=Asticcacaulis sp. AND118 TaxID=2840468 RepID=UPI001CFFD65D|nr:fumarylacetoacetate hydrolase family protein [Asticcacaulis sp. AND118]UDF05689.1 fumarylacetoacetate hydrolase family protein [Asticcacaulis sp. AND118]
MKLLRFGQPGQEKPGLLDSEGRIRDLSGVIADITGSTISDEALAKLAALDPASLPLAPEGVRYGPCVAGVGKFLCIGLNYADHAAESNLPIPEEPVLFTKTTSSIIGPNDEVKKPRGSTKMDWEVELGIIIGKTASYVSEAEAEACIAGYCTINDVSERAFQLDRGGTWDKGKGCDTFGPIGPWLVTRDEVGDPTNLKMWLSVNGKTYQDGSTATMIFKPAFIVSYLSQFMSLHPGDVISTGTPPGVGLGQKPPVYLEVGDVMELGIEGLGTQKQTVIAA